MPQPAPGGQPGAGLAGMPSSNQTMEPVVAGGVGAGAASPADEPVECNGVLCGVPLMIPGLDVRACCSAETQCGLHVVGNDAIADVCIAWMSEGEPNLDCSPFYDAQLFVYRYGCCLQDGVCGEQNWSDWEFGCVDPRALGLPGGAPCDPRNSCKKHDSPCADAAECCPLGAFGTACADFDGSGNICAMRCEQDSDCPTLCCQPDRNGVSVCAPMEACG